MRFFSLGMFLFIYFLGVSGSRASVLEQRDVTDFTRKDWRLICDSTRTCRAVGANANNFALMVTRIAGPNKLSTAVLRLSDFDRNSIKNTLRGSVEKVFLLVNGKLVGRLAKDGGYDYFLNELQTARVVDALAGRDEVSFRVMDDIGDYKTAALSGQGAYAVFLKMDEVQGRLGTSAALVDKGLKGETAALYPLEVPVVRRAVVPKEVDLTFLKVAANVGPIKQKLLSTLSSLKDCPLLNEPQKTIKVNLLSETKVLLSNTCQGDARLYADEPTKDYRVGYWVVDRELLEMPVPVTFNATDYGNGLITASRSSERHDCYEYESWIWDGSEFVLGNSYIKGICRKRIDWNWKIPIVVVDEIIPSGIW